jgi:iron complex transport system substrate-binding protein
MLSQNSLSLLASDEIPDENILYQLGLNESPDLEDIRERLGIIRHKLKFIEQKPAVLVVSQRSGWEVPAGWVPQLVELAGGQTVIESISGNAVPIDLSQVIDADPDVLIIASPNKTLQEGMRQMSGLLALPGFAELNAVKNNRLYLVDGSRYLHQNGVSLADSAEILAEIVHPKQFIFGYEGAAWIKFSV